MNVYISSSWKNRARVRDLAIKLRKAGHEVYDFTDPACRKSPEIPPEAFPEQFDPERHNYYEYLTSNKHWQGAVDGNRIALKQCDVVVLMLPCGNDSHADWALAVGMGKYSIVLGHPNAGERVPSHLWADAFLEEDGEVAGWITTVEDRINNPAEFDVHLQQGVAKILSPTLASTSEGARRIAAERLRQIEIEGWEPSRDLEYTRGQLAWAATCYAAPSPIFAETRGVGHVRFSDPWPWAPAWDKRPEPGAPIDERIRALEKAGALVAAEIDRLLHMKRFT